MKKTRTVVRNILLVAVCLCCQLSLASNQQQPAPTHSTIPLDEVIDFGLKRATAQALLTAEELKDQDGRLPKTIEKGKFVTANYADWTSGFFPGLLWSLYENNPKDSQLLEYAKLFTSRVEEAKNVRSHHDVGFMINCSFGNGFRLTKEPHYKEVMIIAAHSLSSRFNENIGCIQSWGPRSNLWQYPVIIDNMMNLELLAEVSKMTGEERLMTIARRHADTTRKNHFRPNYSTYHVVSYDTLTFQPHVKQTCQGYADHSAWARGQAWGLYGYTMMFRETGDSVYLHLARKIANFIASHPRLPEDGVAYWDFDDDSIPNAYRDASAAAIYASAYLELCKYVPAEESIRWVRFAEKIIRTLTSPTYLAEEGEQHGFILRHCVGNMPNKSEVDVPLTYADYYYVEALLRLKKLRQTFSGKI